MRAAYVIIQGSVYVAHVQGLVIAPSQHTKTRTVFKCLCYVCMLLFANGKHRTRTEHED